MLQTQIRVRSQQPPPLPDPGMFTGGPPAASTDRMELSASVLDLPALSPPNRPADSRFKIALSLYKVQQNIYLLDFQRVEGDVLGFMKLCALVIAELKNLSAANRAMAAQQQQMQQGGGAPGR